MRSKTNKLMLSAAAAIVFSAASVSVHAEDLAKPALFGLCESCHGVGVKAPLPGYPSLAGQDKTYIYNSIKAYQNGDRQGGNAVIMMPMSKMLPDDKSIEDMAAYINSLK